MPAPQFRAGLVCECQKGHDGGPAAHEGRLRKIGIQHFTFKHLIGLGMALPHYDRHLRLDYSGLLECDFRKSLTQHVTMVKTDVGYHAEDRGDDIGTVKTSAESGLEDHEIDFLPCEPVECHECRYLEEGHVQMVESILPLIYEIPHFLLGNQRDTGIVRVFFRPSLDNPHTLSEIQDVR